MEELKRKPTYLTRMKIQDDSVLLSCCLLCVRKYDETAMLFKIKKSSCRMTILRFLMFLEINSVWVADARKGLAFVNCDCYNILAYLAAF